jgi:hypothetical protein
VEREYLSALAEAVALEDWRQIVARAVQDAKAGDARAREWLSKHLMGDDPLALAELADELERVKAMLGVSHDTGRRSGATWTNCGGRLWRRRRLRRSFLRRMRRRRWRGNWPAPSAPW